MLPGTFMYRSVYTTDTFIIRSQIDYNTLAHYVNIFVVKCAKKVTGTRTELSVLL